MKNLIKLLAFTFILFLNTAILHAQPTTNIILKDGSRLKGQVLSLDNGVYKIQTSNLGTLEIDEAEILSISSQEFNPPGMQDNIRGQVENLQGVVMSDPELLSEIENLAQDPEVLEMLSDQQLIQDILSYDPVRIQNNQKLQQLMQNPRMQELIEKVGDKQQSQ